MSIREEVKQLSRADSRQGAAARGRARALLLLQRPQKPKALWKTWHRSGALLCVWLPCRPDQIYSPSLLFFLCILCETSTRILYFLYFLKLHMRKTASLPTVGGCCGTSQNELLL